LDDRRVLGREGASTVSFINDAAREINIKVSYFGPGLAGKTTNLQYIYYKTHPEIRGKLVSLDTDTERTLSFDFIPQSLREIHGLKVRLHLYTVPGPVFYDASRIFILKDVDGVIFVADSQLVRQEANLESLENLMVNLESQGYDPATVPTVLQYNKRDLPSAVPVEEMDRQLLSIDWPRFEAVAPKGVGVFETLKEVLRRILVELRKDKP
jgi:mutual gliding-motility protein MglA